MFKRLKISRVTDCVKVFYFQEWVT